MAKSVNKAMIIGNLGQDPELRYTGSGTAVCNMRVATNESYKDSSGEWVDKTEWHSVVTWARLAEICGEYLKKGSRVYFEGSLQTRQWEDRDGNTKYTTEIKAREMMMLDGRDESGGGGGGGRNSQGDYQVNQDRSSGGGNNRGGGSRRSQPQQQGGGTFEPEDDLPF